jgi:hypothetical protein
MDLVLRWLRARDADVQATTAGAPVALAPGDPLAAALGDRFELRPGAPNLPAPPGVEPVYPGSRIADLLVGDLDGVRGIAVVRPPGDGGSPRPCLVFSFRLVLSTDVRAERLVRLALTPEGEPAPLPAEPAPPLRAAGDASAWREMVLRLLPVARKRALVLASVEVERANREAQQRLYRTARRIALVHGRRRAAPDAEVERAAEFRRMLEEEVDRHQLRVSLALLGVTIAV